MLPLLLACGTLLPPPSGVFPVTFGNLSRDDYPPPLPDLPFPLLRTRGGGPDRDEPLVARDAQDGVVGTGPARRRIDEDEHVLVEHRRRRGLRKHDVQLRGAKHRLRRVERQPSKLGLDQVGAVLPTPRVDSALQEEWEYVRGSPA
jgi:hypothetical protein